MRIEESLNIIFDECLPEPKSSPSIKDDRINDPIFQDRIRSSSLEARASEPGYPKNVKEAKGQPIDQVTGANERPQMLEKGNYIPWESRFRRFLDNILEEGERMWNSIQNRSYVRPMIPVPDGAVNINGTVKQILKPLSKMTEGNKKQYIANVKVMNYLLQAIPNDIYYLVDACKNTKEIRERIKRPMFGSDVTSHKPRVCDAKYFKEQMLLAMKDEAESNLNNEENDFMLDTSYGKETMEELTATVMLMARIQPVDGDAETVPSYDAKAVSEVNASSTVHEQMRHKKCKSIIQTYDDDQIDSNIISDDLYMENNSGTSDHDSNDHDEYHKIQMLAYYVQRETGKNELLKDELMKNLSDFKGIQANILKRIKIVENNFKRSQAQIIDFELKLQHQKDKMVCDVSWKSKLSTLNDDNVLLKSQVESVVQERENIKLEFQKLFNSIKATLTQHQKEVDELIEYVNQNTYAYANVRAQYQDLLMTISELKDKLKTNEKGKNVNTKFDKSKTLGKLVCVTPFNKNLGNKAKNVSNTKVKIDRSKPVTSHPTPKNEQS
nr:hypothetical protein [Tanacetum cinerariifolium]